MNVCGTRVARGVTVAGIPLVLGLVVSLSANPALAKVRPPDKKFKAACVADYTQAKELAQQSKLREARDRMAKCAKVACGSFLQQECGHLYTQLDADIPSVVPVVLDDNGAPRTLVEVKMDGSLLTSKLDGRALQVDPGKHEFTFATDSGVFATENIMIMQGQRNVPVKAQLRPGKKKSASSEESAVASGSEASGSGGAVAGKSTDESKAAKSSDSSTAQAEDGEEEEAKTTTVRKTVNHSGGVPVLTYILGGVGVVGVGGYFVLNQWGRKDNDKLTGCASMGQLCMPSAVDHVKSLYLAANISGGIGLAALAASAWVYFSSQSSAEETTTTKVAARDPNDRNRGAKGKWTSASIRMVDLQATPSGTFASVGGSF